MKQPPPATISKAAISTFWKLCMLAVFVVSAAFVPLFSMEDDHQLELRREASDAHKNKNYKLAIELYTKASQRSSKDIYAHSELAWILATCPKPEFRDGPKAVKLALKAAEIARVGEVIGSMKVTYSPPYEAMAAAYAEIGDYKNAINFKSWLLSTLTHDSPLWTPVNVLRCTRLILPTGSHNRPQRGARRAFSGNWWE